MVVLRLAEDTGLAIPEDHNLSNTVMIFAYAFSLSLSLSHATKIVLWNMFVQDRVQLISKMPVQEKKYLTSLNGSLSGKVS